MLGNNLTEIAEIAPSVKISKMDKLCNYVKYIL